MRYSQSLNDGTRPKNPRAGKRMPPGPPDVIGLRNILRLRRNPLRFLLDLAVEFGDVVRAKFGPNTVFALYNPEHVKHVLQESPSCYGRQTRGYKVLQLALGQGLVTSEGDFWLRQRRIMQPAFHRDHIARFATVMIAETEAMLAGWRGVAERGGTLDVDAEMMRLTLSIVGKTLFSTDVSSEAETVRRSVTEMQEYLSERIQGRLSFPLSIPTPANRRFRAAVAIMDGILNAKLIERRSDGADGGDLLSMLMKARDEETGEGMSDQQLRDEAITMFGAGHETTATALSWIFCLLSQHPIVLRRLRVELDMVLAGRVPDADDVQRLPYATMVIKEAMRLYPPVWAMARHAIVEDELAGFTIPAGSIVVLCPYVTHRLPSLWENPEGFDPERFAPDRIAVLPRFAYFPFGGGGHLCIGQGFAMMEALLILAMVVQRYELHLLPGRSVEPLPLITLRPRYGLRMTVLPAKVPLPKDQGRSVESS